MKSNQKGIVFLPILIIIVLLGVIGFSIYRNYQLNPSNFKPVAEDSKPSPTISPDEEPVPSSENIFNFYYVKIKRMPGAPLPSEQENYSLAEYLINVFDLPKMTNYNEVISKIVYDTREGDPYSENSNIYNFNYYIVLKQGKIDVSKIYKDEYTTIEVSSADSKLYPYIVDSEYCKQNSECVIRRDFCTVDSFNFFHGFADVWGCGPPSDKTGYTFQVYDESRGCTTKVEFSGSACQSNRCVGLNKKIVCIDEEPLGNP